MRAWIGMASCLGLLGLVGCASGGTRDGDGGRRDGSIIRLDASARDAGGVSCPTGQHACGAGCINDLANEPNVGCRLGCGEPCPAPPDGEASCLATGRCSFGCAPPFVEVGSECVCDAMECIDLGFDCGAPDDGCGTPLDCGTCAVGTCNAGHCSCGADSYEPNEDDGDAVDLGTAADSPPTDLHVTDGGIESTTDEDWYVVYVDDALSGTDPDMDITLSNVPAGATYTLTAEFVCEGGGTDSECDGDTAGSLLGLGGVGCEVSVSGGGTEMMNIYSVCDPINDSGYLYLRVRATTHSGTCEPYRIDLSVY